MNADFHRWNGTGHNYAQMEHGFRLPNVVAGGPQTCQADLKVCSYDG
jgi:hypothetical protein